MRFLIAMMMSVLLALSCSSIADDAATNRPSIGLVLGGGGALGLSHVGVLKELERMRIPVDYIAGTSMGSIIAGLYASGMAPEEIEEFLKHLDWNDVLSDETPRRDLFFRRKYDDQKYLFEIGIGNGGIKLGAGMAAGQKFNNLMQYATLHAAGITNFDELPIPFRAIATDLESGKPYVIDHGNLGLAMRASMAVPGVFTPIEIDGKILVDGGVVNNLPVDVVKEMGADIIIAVDVGASADKVDLKKLRTLAGVLGRTYSIAQRPSQVEQFKRADIGIQPDLGGLSAAQFDKLSDFVPLGEKAAMAVSNQLSSLSVDDAEYQEFLATHRLAKPENVIIGDVTITGNERVATRVMQGRIRTKPGDAYDHAQVTQDLLRLYGIGEFERVLFTMTPGSNETSTLTYDALEKPWGPLYFKYGLNLRSDFENDTEWAMLLNLTRMSVNSLGAEWRNELQVGSTLALNSEFYQPLDASAIWFLAPNVQYASRMEDVYDGKDHIAEYDVTRFDGRLDFGVQLRQYAELRAGPIWGTGSTDVEIGNPDELEETDEDYAGWGFSFAVDRQDRTWFARKGYFAEVYGSFAREGMGGDRDFDRMVGQARTINSLGDHTLQASVMGGSSLNSDLPAYAEFGLGGMNFSGLADNQFRGDYLGIGSLTYRYRLVQLPVQLGRGVYTQARFDTGNVWAEKIDLDDLRYGGSFGLAIDSTMGPIYLGYGMADGGYDRFFFTLGTMF